MRKPKNLKLMLNKVKISKIHNTAYILGGTNSNPHGADSHESYVNPNESNPCGNDTQETQNTGEVTGVFNTSTQNISAGNTNP